MAFIALDNASLTSVVKILARSAFACRDEMLYLYFNIISKRPLMKRLLTDSTFTNVSAEILIFSMNMCKN
jgi:hypothetical protein